MSILPRLKANIIPTLAVITVPFGYFFGIQLPKWQQLSEEERVEQLKKQRAALLEERRILLEKQTKNKE
ncbi:hypothetical protein BDC45DRAFT_573684 [Circinella umbellata]|nr:hypothetical protein BDC45DRAFT_573684 [Circinella umbellata]